MTRVTTSTDLSSFTTDAKFRSWGSSFSTALASAGLVQTSDTGQINWTTVARPTAAITVAGYEIWRFNDTLQSTYPVYIKIEYATGTNASGNDPRIYWTVGKGSNGSGTITTPWLTQATNTSSTTAANNTTTVGLFTHTEGYFLAHQDSFLLSNPGLLVCGIVIDRTRNQTTGAVTSEGLYIAYASSALSVPANVGCVQCSIDFGTNTVITSNNLFSPPGDSSSYGSYAFPCYSWINGLKVQAACVGVSANDIAASSTFTLKTIGTSITHTYLCMGAYNATSLFSDSSFSALANEGTYRLAVMWED